MNMKLILYSDNIENDIQIKNESFNVSISHIIPVLVKWGTDSCMNVFINAVRYNKNIKEMSEQDDDMIEDIRLLISMLNECILANTTLILSVNNGCVVTFMENVPYVVGNELVDLLCTNSLVGNFFHAVIVHEINRGPLATHLVCVKCVSEEPYIEKCTAQVLRRFQTEMCITAFPARQFHYATGLRTCSAIQKCIRHLHSTLTNRSCDSRIFLLCLSPDSNPIRIIDIFGRDTSSEIEFEYWLPILQQRVAEVVESAAVSEDGDISVTTGYSYLLFSFGKDINTWVKEEVMKCFTQLEVVIGSPKTIVMTPPLQQLTEEYRRLKSSFFDKPLDEPITEDEWDAAYDRTDIAASDLTKFAKLHMKRLKALYSTYLLNGDIDITDQKYNGQWIAMTDGAVPSQFYATESEAFEAGSKHCHVPPQIFTAQIGDTLLRPFDLPKPELSDLLLMVPGKGSSSHTIPFFPTMQIGPREYRSKIHEHIAYEDDCKRVTHICRM